MALALFQIAPPRGTGTAVGGDAAGQFAGHVSGNFTWCGCARQRLAQKIPGTFAVHRPYPVCQLLHDRDFSDSGALSFMVMGSTVRDRSVCRPDLVRAPFRVDAGPPLKPPAHRIGELVILRRRHRFFAPNYASGAQVRSCPLSRNRSFPPAFC